MHLVTNLRAVTKKTVTDVFTFAFFQRSPLDKLVLQVKILGLGEPKAVLALALSPPRLDYIARTVITLKEVSFMLDAVDWYAYMLTHADQLLRILKFLD